MSEKTKNKIRDKKKGKKAWNKGLTRENNESVLKYVKNRKIIYTEEIKNKMSNSAKKRCSLNKYKDKFKNIMNNGEIRQKRINTSINNGSHKGNKNGRYIYLNIDKLIELYNENFSVNYIAKYFNVDRHVINNRIEYLGLKIKRKIKKTRNKNINYKNEFNSKLE